MTCGSISANLGSFWCSETYFLLFHKEMNERNRYMGVSKFMPPCFRNDVKSQTHGAVKVLTNFNYSLQCKRSEFQDIEKYPMRYR